ncbi:hypothetical protein D7004_03840 [Pedobacter jejuensis]|uniref:Polysaccharide lyase 14 domain-containing protein n=2 Tax=Pedobacter jejuensis TaxID=1268550 RepID=A0A3N0C113_9SPHI|nr:hypothetical protein D7004_03840 [Pedobacter jejuensis]
MNYLNLRFKKLLCAAVCSTLLFSCEKDSAERQDLQATRKVDIQAQQSPSASNAVFVQSYGSRPNGPYVSTEFVSDHGGTGNAKSGNWSTSRCKIENGNFVVKLLANMVNWQGGLVAYSDIPNAANYEVKFNIKFSSGFNFQKGGKAGFGFGVGQVAAGGEGAKARSGAGGSYRLMWTNVGTQSGKFKFKPYAYFQSMTGDFGGEASSSEYPAGSGEIQSGVWYTVYMQINMNSEGTANGKYIFDVWETDNKLATYKRVERTNINWASGANRTVTQLMCDTFRGGAANDGYESGSDGWISYDEVTVNNW